MKRFLVPFGIFMILFVFLGAGLRLNPREVPSPFIGKPAPQFAASSLEDSGKSVAPSDMAGKVWLLNVWASWCASCRVEHPVLMGFARAGSVPVVGLNYKDQRDEGIGWLRQHGNPYVLSAFDQDGQIGIDYGVYGVPETFVIDKHGVIRFKHAGPLTQQVMTDTILPLIKELNGA